jgi:hypothetical protein
MQRRKIFAVSFVLSLLFACAAPDAPVVSSRTERLVGLTVEIVDTLPEVPFATQGGLCNTVDDCKVGISLPGVDLFSECILVECRRSAGTAIAVAGRDYEGRCYATRRASTTLVCVTDMVTSLLAENAFGLLHEPAVTVGLGADCASRACEPDQWCVDGVCCESECGGGNPNDCWACSRLKGGPANGLCRPVLNGNTCRPHLVAADSCFQGGVCAPDPSGVGTFDAQLYDGVCRGVLAEDVKCCDPAVDACEPPSSCVDFECKEPDAGVPVDMTVDANVWSDAGTVERDAAPVDARVAPDSEMLDARVRDASERLDAWSEDAAARDMSTDMATETDAAKPDAHVAIDAAIAVDATVPNTPVFRGGGGIRCAVSSPGASNGENETAAGTLSLLAAALCFIRRKRA